MTLWAGLGAPAWLLVLEVVVLVVMVGFGVTVGYHRVLTHRAATLNPWVERALILFALPAGTPVQWIGNHRRHHAVADTDDDVHSPVRKGFWIAHCGWYLETTSVPLSIAYACAGPLRTLFDAWWRPRTNQQWVHLAPDVAADPVYRFLSTRAGYALGVLGYIGALWSTTVAAFGARGAIAIVVVHYLAYTFGDLVNSAGHGPGGRTFDARDESKDAPWLAFVALGDGWHNGHHAFPYSARAGLSPGQIDMSWVFLRALERIGLARDLRVPTAAQIAAKRAGAVDDEAMARAA